MTGAPLRILVIEDCSTDFKLIRRQVEGLGFAASFSWIADRDQLSQSLLESWDLVLADYNVPHMVFEETLETIRGRYPELPVILVSGSVGEEQAVELLKHGMSDFVHKDNLPRLAPCITRALKEAKEHRARLLAEEALMLSERKYRSMFDHAPVGVGIGELDTGRLVETNQAWLEIFGFEHDEVVGRTGTELGIYLSGVQRQAIVRHLQEHGRIINQPLRLRKKSGEAVDLLYSAEILSIGSTSYLQFMLTDVTQEMQTRQALATSEETLRKLYVAVNQSPTAIVITDRHGTIDFVNPRFSELTGYTAEEMVGKNPQLLWANLCKGEVWQGDFCNTRKDGTVYWEHDIISPIRNQAGEITHYMAIKEDVSEKRAMEEQLRQAQKMEAVGQLAGGVAHDFNNIMQVITGNAYLQIMENQLRGVETQHLDEIVKAVEHGSSLTKSLLVFSRKNAVELTNFDLNDLLGQSRKLATKLVTEEIAIELELCPEPLHILADVGLVQQIVFNLVTNARDAISARGSITIKTLRVEAGQATLPCGCGATCGSYAQLSVRDTGHGIPEEIRGRIFEPFFTTKEVGKGTGLGLSMIYGTVQRMNGFTSVSAPPQGGTEFIICIPLTAPPAEAPKLTEQGGLAGSGELVLVVEDEEAVRSALTRTLVSSGYRAIAAGSGEEALALARRNTGIALALIDVILPGINGIECGQGLNALHPSLPVIFLTGYDNDILAGRGIMANVLHKPIQSSRLIQRIREVLEARAAQGG
ncbi:PAS domain S-box protein [Geomonas sp. Red69]|uniref:hybrid sensor histidine kinase/response regulator n=1 Tax=Geomonas diazotrophica TaxID=2843197 RepID=UPI001C0FC77B|nr:PAS domain S-box protein [Geomonas diazotrophica]MBU5636698.1 PAS domain S-box protein [Geomonas diazotrophica]